MLPHAPSVCVWISTLTTGRTIFGAFCAQLQAAEEQRSQQQSAVEAAAAEAQRQLAAAAADAAAGDGAAPELERAEAHARQLAAERDALRSQLAELQHDFAAAQQQAAERAASLQPVANDVSENGHTGERPGASPPPEGRSRALVSCALPLN